MAQSLQLLKRRIKTSKNIAQIAKAMEMISASKIKKGQVASVSNLPYANKITDMVFAIIKNLEEESYSHPYLEENGSKKILVIAISPDKGLCGSLNTNLRKLLINQDSKNVKLITVGKKIEQFSSSLNFEIISAFPFGAKIPDYGLVSELKSLVNENFLGKRMLDKEIFTDDSVHKSISKENVSEVYLLYSEFQSLFIQRPKLQKLLPLDSEIASEDDVSEIKTALFEPNLDDILDDLLPYYLEVQIYNALLQAFTSEQGARMVAMQNAKNNAKDIADFLTLSYNKSRQEKITNEILELTNIQQ